MPETKKESPLTLGKIGTALKTWLPIVMTIGTIVVGYFVFKSETRHQIELQQRETSALQVQIEQLREDINQNRREWQRDMDSRVDTLETSNTRILIRLKVLEGRPLDGD